jgi:hypothetical protein
MIYDAQGHPIEENNCLVVETDSLPDAEQQDFMSVLESEPAQQSADLFSVFARSKMSNGYTVLDWLDKSGRLHKYKTSNIIMTPNPSASLQLDKLNLIVKMQKEGASEDVITAKLKQQFGDDVDELPVTESVDEVESKEVEPTTPDAMLLKADSLDGEVAELRRRATTLKSNATALRKKAAAFEKKSTASVAEITTEADVEPVQV